MKNQSARTGRPSPRPRARARWPGAALLVACAGLGFWALAPAPARRAEPSTEGMVWVPGGEFSMGVDRKACPPEVRRHLADAQPVHTVHVDGFWMDSTEVTNEQFAAFVEATGYKTHAERHHTPEEFPGAPPETLVPGSLVFSPPTACPPDEECCDCARWWVYVPGACWKHPEGPHSTLAGRERHPVVHVAWEDAVAYARWAGKRLPTEAEWERAARGGLERRPFYWGDELTPGGKWMANIWQGKFPCENTRADGHEGTAPVGSYPPNGYGLYDMAGNVWEWCADWYRPGYEVAGAVTRNPQGPDSSVDPNGHGEPKRVQRGGSFLCSDGFCARYRAGARGQGEPRTGQSHTGFRCVLSPKKEG
jgi:formylglycine-generating enzyme